MTSPEEWKDWGEWAEWVENRLEVMEEKIEIILSGMKDMAEGKGGDPVVDAVAKIRARERGKRGERGERGIR